VIFTGFATLFHCNTALPEREQKYEGAIFFMENNKSKTALFIERMHENFEDFRDNAIEVGGEYLFIVASEVVAVKEVHEYLSDEVYIDEDDAAFLLTLENPLKTLADEWEVYKTVENDDFGEFLEDFIRRGNTGHGMTTCLACELREKYGAETPLNTACLLEIVEIGRSLFGLIESEDDTKGGGF
jgi:hypothetical protein